MCRTDGVGIGIVVVVGLVMMIVLMMARTRDVEREEEVIEEDWWVEGSGGLSDSTHRGVRPHGTLCA